MMEQIDALRVLGEGSSKAYKAVCGINDCNMIVLYKALDDYSFNGKRGYLQIAIDGKKFKTGPTGTGLEITDERLTPLIFLLESESTVSQESLFLAIDFFLSKHEALLKQHKTGSPFYETHRAKIQTLKKILQK